MKYKNLIYLFVIALLFGCEPKINDEYTPEKGSADFTSYVAIGNSLSAGYADGALSSAGQMYSFPSMLAQQFAKVGMQGEFTQPTLNSANGVGILVGPTGLPYFITKRVLGISADCLGEVSLGPVLADPGASQADLAALVMTPIAGDDPGRPFNNLGIPGMKSYEALSPLNSLNPFYGRMASNPGTSSVLSDAALVQPTFFSLWLGNNDVLLYATSGGAADSITSAGTFQFAMTTILDGLAGMGATKGVICNVPDITSVPFFTSIPYNAIVITNPDDAALLNAAYAKLNAIIIGAGSTDTIHFTLGQNAMVIQDANLPWGMRQIKAGELVCLTMPLDSIKCAGWGTQKPVPGSFILDMVEKNAVVDATEQYNVIIKNLADERGLAHVDMHTYMKQLESGLVYDGYTYTATFVTGGAFSLDAVHPNPQGYAILANFMIDAINNTYSSKLPRVNVGDYPGVIFP